MRQQAGKFLRVGLMSLALTGTTFIARADTVFDTVGTMIGGAQFESYTFDISAPGGDYLASLTDYAFPTDSFDFLSMAITRGAAFYGAVQGGGSFVFSPVEAGTYTTLVFGVPGGLYSAGSYGISIDKVAISPVPEPQTWAFLLTGLGLMLMRIRQRESEPKHLAAD